MSSIYRRGTVYWIKWYSRTDKKHHAKALLYPDGRKVKNKQDALYFKAKHDQQFLLFNPSDGVLTAAQAVEMFLTATKPRRGSAWDITAKRRLHVLISSESKKTLQELTTLQLEAALNEIHERKKLSAKTRNDYLTLLRSFYKWAISRGIAFHDPSQSIGRLKEEKRKRVFLSEDQWEKLIELAQANPHFPMIATALYTGLRRNELSLLSWQDVDLQRKQLKVRAEVSKNKEDRIVPLPEALVSILEPLRKPNGLCFPGPTGEAWKPAAMINVLKPLLKAAGAYQRRRVWHLLRHSYSTRYLNRGGLLRRLQKRLGHRSIDTTEIYAHDAGQEQDVDRIV